MIAVGARICTRRLPKIGPFSGIVQQRLSGRMNFACTDWLDGPRHRESRDQLGHYLVRVDGAIDLVVLVHEREIAEVFSC